MQKVIEAIETEISRAERACLENKLIGEDFGRGYISGLLEALKIVKSMEAKE